MFICVGEGANFVSYAFAPLAVVAPLNAVSVLSEYSAYVLINSRVSLRNSKAISEKFYLFVFSLYIFSPASSILGFIFLHEKYKAKEFASKSEIYVAEDVQLHRRLCK